MVRKPFDPGAAAGGLFPEKPAEREALTVTEAARLVDAALQQHLPRPTRVVGQVSGFTDRNHWYFSLKDAESVISCVMWAGRAGQARSRPADGDEVVASGAFNFWGRSGRTQLIVESIQPRGLGTLEQQFRALYEELKGKGWFEESRKPPLPSFPRRIAIVTSATGAALRDCLATAQARCPAVAILVVDVRVQGDGAAREVSRAIRRLDAAASKLGIDAILVTRGGGSREELWAFNEREVAEAAFRCRTPLLAAIGHEPDVEIIELVAHRGATPTRGIVMLLPDREALQNHADHLASRFQNGVLRRLHLERERLRALARRPVLARPHEWIDTRRQELNDLARRLRSSLPAHLQASRRRLAEAILRAERLRPSSLIAAGRERVRQLHFRLGRGARGVLDRRRAVLDAAHRHLTAVGPAQVMARGYSITLDSRGRLLRSAAAVKSGERVETRLASGSFTSVVESR